MMCVCDNLNWMENGWMENGLSGCECGKWKVARFRISQMYKETKFIKTVIGDVVAHLKPQKFTVSLYL